MAAINMLKHALYDYGDYRNVNMPNFHEKRAEKRMALGRLIGEIKDGSDSSLDYYVTKTSIGDVYFHAASFLLKIAATIEFSPDEYFGEDAFNDIIFILNRDLESIGRPTIGSGGLDYILKQKIINNEVQCDSNSGLNLIKYDLRTGRMSQRIRALEPEPFFRDDPLLHYVKSEASTIYHSFNKWRDLVNDTINIYSEQNKELPQFLVEEIIREMSLTRKMSSPNRDLRAESAVASRLIVLIGAEPAGAGITLESTKRLDSLLNKFPDISKHPLAFRFGEDIVWVANQNYEAYDDRAHKASLVFDIYVNGHELTYSANDWSFNMDKYRQIVSGMSIDPLSQRDPTVLIDKIEALRFDAENHPKLCVNDSKEDAVDRYFGY